MPAPSLEVTIGDRGPASPQPGDIGTWFVAALADHGPVGTVTECLSLNAVQQAYGDVVAYSHLIRAAEAYFREANGWGRMLVTRIVGPAATAGELDLSSTAPAVVLTVTAISPGDWSDALTITVTASTGSGRIVTLKHAGETILTGEYTTDTGLQDALDATGLVTASLGPGSWPIAVLAETPLAGGDDDRASIPSTVDGWLEELEPFELELGAGTVSLPGITTPAAHEALLRHGEMFKRFAALDAIDTPTVASLTAPAGDLRDLDETAGYGQMLAPWVRIPGPGTELVAIPPSGAVAGRMAAADHENSEGPGQPAAGRFGELRWVRDVTQEWTQAQRDTLSEAGVTVIRNIRGRVQPYDALTLADPATWPQYAEANGMRVVLAIYSEMVAAMEPYVLRVIDGNRHLLSEINKDLVAICQSWYARRALYGATAAEAFNVDTGTGVNPDEALAQRRISAQVDLRTSPFVSHFGLLITKVAAGDTI